MKLMFGHSNALSQKKYCCRKRTSGAEICLPRYHVQIIINAKIWCIVGLVVIAMPPRSTRSMRIVQ